MDLKVGIRYRILEDKVILTRQLTQPGKILVKPDRLVKPEDIVAEGLFTPGFRSVPLAKSLGVDTKKAEKFLKIKIGDKVFAGEKIAVRKTFFRQIEVASPIDGIVGEYNNQTGFLKIEFTTTKERLTAACWGKVSKIYDDRVVEIETQILKISGVAGTGRTREGELEVLAKPTDFLLPNLITPQHKDKIIFGGAQITKASLAKALSLQVAGIIAGGIHTEDFFEAGGGKLAAFWASSDVGITLVILEGFGLRPVDGELFKIFEDSDGKFVIISGDAAEIILPQTLEVRKSQLQGRVKSNEVADKEKTLKIGDRVRVIDPVYCGLTGVVGKISKSKKLTKIGLSSFLVEVETTSGKIVQPWQNLEILA